MQSGAPYALTRRGFTLTEILITIALISVLASLLLGVTTQMRAKGTAARCLSNLRQLGLGLERYTQENQGKYPPHWSPQTGWAWYGYIAMYLCDWDGNPSTPMHEVFRCPAQPRRLSQVQTYMSEAFNVDQSYGYNYAFLSSNPYVGFPSNSRRLHNLSRLITIGEIPTLRSPEDVVSFPAGLPWLQLYPSASDIGQPVFGISRRHNGQANFLFADGHVESRSSVDLVGKDYDPDNWSPYEQMPQ